MATDSKQPTSVSNPLSVIDDADDAAIRSAIRQWDRQTTVQQFERSLAYGLFGHAKRIVESGSIPLAVWKTAGAGVTAPPPPLTASDRL